MQVPYNHPPRKLNFYLRILLWLTIICVPIVIVLPIWYPYVFPIWLFGLVVVALVFRVGSVFKQTLQLNLSIEDYHLPKSMDISGVEMDVPDVLEDTKLLLELEGFERLGELESYSALSEKPIPEWLFSKANGKILAAATAISGKPFMAFMTYGEDGLVMTYYPRGHRLNLDNARYSGVSSSIEDAYRYHLKQVKEVRSNIGQVVPVNSVKDYLSLDKKYSHLSIQHQWMPIHDFIITQTLMSVVFAFAYALFASWMFPNIFLGLFWDWRLSGAAILIAGSLLLGLLVENRKNGIRNIEKA